MVEARNEKGELLKSTAGGVAASTQRLLGFTNNQKTGVLFLPTSTRRVKHPLLLRPNASQNRES